MRHVNTKFIKGIPLEGAIVFTAMVFTGNVFMNSGMCRMADHYIVWPLQSDL